MTQEKSFEELRISCMQTLKALVSKLNGDLNKTDVFKILHSMDQSILTIKKIQEWQK